MSANASTATPPAKTTPGSLGPLASAPPQDGDEVALNRQALARLSKAVWGYDTLKKEHDAVTSEAQSLRIAAVEQQQRVEELRKRSDEKDGRIAELEEENKGLREDVEFYEDSVATRKANREFKRQKTQ